MTRTELQQRALALPETERLALADALFESLAPFWLDSGEQAKVDKALEAYRANPGDVRPADEVHRRIAHRLARE
jgi:putative addiction module component (TIGR02574 family)